MSRYSVQVQYFLPDIAYNFSQGKTNNFAHSTLKEVAIKFFYVGSYRITDKCPDQFCNTIPLACIALTGAAVHFYWFLKQITYNWLHTRLIVCSMDLQRMAWWHWRWFLNSLQRSTGLLLWRWPRCLARSFITLITVGSYASRLGNGEKKDGM